MPDQYPDRELGSKFDTGTQNYELKPNWTIAEVMAEAWQLKNGFKSTYWGALLLYTTVAMVISGVFEFVGSGSTIMKIISQLVSGLVGYPLWVGLMMIAIKHSVGTPTDVSMIFAYYPKTIPIFLNYLLMMVLVLIGLSLLVLPGIYLAFAYTLAMPLIVEKNLGPWDALEASRKAITPCWFRTFGLFFVSSIILMISALPIGIGLIWTVPFLALVMAIVYRNLIGVSQFN